MRLYWTFCLLILSASWSLAGKADGKLDVTWVDTEGGGATLIVTPAGESVLIDTGNPAKAGEAPRDAARIFKAIQAAGLSKIDFLVVTHYHIDHFGGAAELSSMIPIGVVYDNGEFAGGHERPSKEYLGFKTDKRATINPGEELPVKNLSEATAPKLTIRCLCARTQTVLPPAGEKPAPAGEHPRRKLDDYSDNANSVVLLVQFGSWRMYAGGDVTWNTEEKLAWPVNLVGTVDVYQVTHHGLDVSNNPALVKAIQPTVAVFCNGPTKGAMPEPMATMKSIDSIVGIYQMHRNMRPNEEKVNVPDEFIANGGKEDQATPIRCSVSADAKTYTISIASTKHGQTYQTRPKGAEK